MKQIRAVFLSSIFLVVSSARTTAGGQVPVIKVEPMRQLRKGVDAWPLIVNPSSPSEQKVNTTLTRLNLRLTKALSDCDAGTIENMKSSGRPHEDWAGATAGDWLRKVAVTMRGPRFLSLVATDEYVNCGGSHPESDTMAMVFDMTTGTPVNWLSMVANSAGASAFADTVNDGSKVEALILPALAKINSAAANADCKDAFQDPQSFQLWPDAKAGTLVAQAFDMPHVVAECAIQIPLTNQQTRALGFDESLLSAVDQAHHSTVVTKK